MLIELLNAFLNPTSQFLVVCFSASKSQDRLAPGSNFVRHYPKVIEISA
jgi:hypothetical protein